MIITNPLLPVPFPFSGIFKGITGSNPEMDGPTSVTISSKKVIQHTRTVGGYVFSHWGDEPERMTVKGSVILLPTHEGLGFLSLFILKTLYKLDKKKIRNMLQSQMKYIPSIAALTASAFGELYSQKLLLGSNASTVSQLSLGAQTALIAEGIYSATKNIQQYMKTNPDLSVTYIYHDNHIYRGFFENFSYTRDASNPRFINYQFNFVIDWSTENFLSDILQKLTKGQTISGFGAV